VLLDSRMEDNVVSRNVARIPRISSTCSSWMEILFFCVVFVGFITCLLVTTVFSVICRAAEEVTNTLSSSLPPPPPSINKHTLIFNYRHFYSPDYNFRFTVSFQQFSNLLFILKTETAHYSETLVWICRITWRDFSKQAHAQNRSLGSWQGCYE